MRFNPSCRALLALFALLSCFAATPAIAKKDAVDKNSKQDIVTEYHKLFHNNRKTWLENKWLGITTLQNPNDVWIHQEIIYDTKPDFIIEAGTYHGGSAVIWAMILEQINPSGRVITLDIKDPPPAVNNIDIYKRKVDFIKGSSTDPEIVKAIGKKVAGKKVLVILDSLHTKEHVLNEIKAYSPMVQVGGYLIVQDTNMHGHPVYPDWPEGPMEAVMEFLKTNKNFQIDKNRERLMHTMHPNGYLKRIR